MNYHNTRARNHKQHPNNLSTITITIKRTTGGHKEYFSQKVETQ